jgi:hypothetical protein
MMFMRWFTMGILAVLMAACTTFEIIIEKPFTPDTEAVSTLANLMLEGTQYAQILAERGITPEPPLPTPHTGIITGRLCYPGSSTPSLSVYFLNTATDEIYDINVAEYQNEYMIELDPGIYFVYGWAPQYMVGGLYSQKVLCGEKPECTDHAPVSVILEAGAIIEEIDLCDWGLPAENLPLPPGFQLPGNKVLLTPIE